MLLDKAEDKLSCAALSILQAIRLDFAVYPIKSKSQIKFLQQIRIGKSDVSKLLGIVDDMASGINIQSHAIHVEEDDDMEIKRLYPIDPSVSFSSQPKRHDEKRRCTSSSSASSAATAPASASETGTLPADAYDPVVFSCVSPTEHRADRWSPMFFDWLQDLSTQDHEGSVPLDGATMSASPSFFER